MWTHTDNSLMPARQQACSNLLVFSVLMTKWNFPNEIFQSTVSIYCITTCIGSFCFTIDMLRCESLNSLDSAACSRVLQKNYRWVCACTVLCPTMLHVLYATLSYAMLSYAMLCCAMLCYAMLCYAMLCYAMLCYAMLCYAMLCYAMLCYAMLCYAMLCYAMLCYAMLSLIWVNQNHASQ